MKDSRFWRGLAAVVELAFAGAVAYFAWVQADVSNRQLTSMDDQNKIMQNQMRQTDETLTMMSLESAALISVSPPIVKDFEIGKLPVFTYAITNSGKTPAKILTLRSKPFFAAIGGDLKDELNFEGDWGTERGGQIIPPAQTDQINVYMDEPFNDDDVALALTGDKPLHLAVVVRYTDKLQTEGLTRAVFHYRPKEGFFAGPDYGIMEQNQPERQR